MLEFFKDNKLEILRTDFDPYIGLLKLVADVKKDNFVRKKIRLHALEMTSRGGSSHIGSILSIADILAVLF